MADVTLDEMRQALKRGVTIRNRYFYDETDPVSALRDGASEAEILDLEAAIGYRLPAYYRLFLLISNGWDFVDAHISLMSTHDIKRSHKSKEFEKWYADMGNYELDYPKNVLAIGTSDITEAKYLLVLPDFHENNQHIERHTNEWPIMYLSESSDYTYDNFMDFLAESENMYNELVENDRL